MKAAILALVLAGCATLPPATAGPTAALGQLATVNGLSARPIAIVEDSRCPIDAICVWAGRLVVRTEVLRGKWRQTHDLEMGKPQQTAGGTLTLTAAQPSRQAGVETDPRAYRFTFEFRDGL